MSFRILRIAIVAELDVVAARQRAREIAVQCKFAMQDQVRIATTVSELARDIYNYASGGRLEYSIADVEGGQALVIRIEYQGRGTPASGTGLGITGARRLMDGFEISTAEGERTAIVMHKLLSADAPHITMRMVGEMSERLGAVAPDSMMGEVQQQNQDLIITLDELKARQEELLKLTCELEETNRGMVALYAELDEKAERLRRADDTKSRFLANMSHEFRTPLSSIRALSKLLLARVDGDLSTEQERQVGFILKSTVALNDMVDDLLDLAKIEAGKIDVRPEQFEVRELFGALRGMLRPLLVNPGLTLTFHEPERPAILFTDQGKLSQILRNFVSNAIKFTERGRIDVHAALDETGRAIVFSVADTGLGIATHNLELIFEEFQQVENHLQAKVKGTGLGLPLCRKLAGLLNGSVRAKSEIGAGSVFTATIPLHYIAPQE